MWNVKGKYCHLSRFCHHETPHALSIITVSVIMLKHFKKSFLNFLFQHSIFSLLFSSVQFSSVAQSCPSNPMDCSTLGFPVYHQLPELAQLMFIDLVMPSNHLILCCPLFLLPSIFGSIRVFSNESVLRIRWPKDWSFTFSISPSNEYSGKILKKKKSIAGN